MDPLKPDPLPQTRVIPTPTRAAAPTASGAEWTLPAPGRSGTVSVFGDYEVIAELGEGGMGRVYKATDRKLGRLVAIKVLRSSDPFEASRFRGEAELIAMLDHPNIIRIFDIETTPEGRPYLVLEYAEGGSLDRQLGGQPQVPRWAAETMELLARAVHHAHENKVLHRDLKPANVLRMKDGTFKLSDFGLAKELEVSSGMTPSGAVMGTPSYMAPEQADGKVKTFTPATDVYGLGAILYEMLTGRPPFRGVNMLETLEQVRWAEPAAPSQLVPRLPRDLTTICLKCLQKTPTRRYQTASELADDLRRWLNGETIVARRAPAWERVWRQVRRRPWQAATLAATVLLIVLMTIAGVYLREQNAQELAKQKLQDVQKTSADQLRERGEKSLAALEGIREMLVKGDLRTVEKLEPLKDWLFAYYETLNEELRNDDGYDKGKLAKSWFELGELVYETGKKEQARKAFRKALDLYDGTMGGTPESLAKLAEVQVKLGRVEFDLNHNAEVEPACAAAIGRLEQIPPGPNPRRDGLLADVWHLRGELFSRQRQIPKAIKAYEEAIRLRTQAVGPLYSAKDAELVALGKENPRKLKEVVEHLRGLARGYGYLGDVLLDDAQPHGADKAYSDSLRIRDLVVKSIEGSLKPANRTADPDALTAKDLEEAKIQLARGWENFAQVQRYTRALGAARHFTETALNLRQAMVKDSPTNNVMLRRDLCNNMNALADLRLHLCDDVVEDDIEKLLKGSREVPADAGSESKWTADSMSTVAQSHLLLAEFHVRRDRRNEAVGELGEAMKLYKKLAELRPNDPGVAFNLAATYALSAKLDDHEAAHMNREALEALKSAAEHRYRDKHPDDIREMWAFKNLRDTKEFQDFLDELRKKRSPVRTSGSSPSGG